MPALTFTIAEELTEVEASVLDILSRTLRPGFCPSREELSRAVGLGGRGYHINKVLASLEAKAYIRRAPGRSRAITLLRTADGRPFSFNTVWAPLIGQIVASKPLPSAGQAANPFAGEAIELTRGLVQGYDDVYALRVKGSSMTDALVGDGDTVVVSATAEVQNGDMVVASVVQADGEEATTLKYYFRENGHVRLQPAHPDMAPLYFRPGQVTIQGKVVLVIRQMG
jgi:repressor LexA